MNQTSCNLYFGTFIQDVDMIRSLAGRGEEYDYERFVINVDYSRPVPDITSNLLRLICENLDQL